MFAALSSALLALGMATASPAVAPPLSDAAPASALPTVGTPMVSANFTVPGVAQWFAVSCQPSPTRPAWNITGTGALPANVDTATIGWPIALLAADAGGAVLWDSGCFLTTTNPPSVGLISSSVSGEIDVLSGINYLGGLPIPNPGSWLPVLPGAATSTSPSESTAAINAPPTAAPTTTAPVGGSAPAPAPQHLHHGSAGLQVLLLLSFLLSGFGLARARKRSEGRYEGVAGDHTLFFIHALIGEIAPVIGGILALVAGAQHPGPIGWVGCFLAGLLAAFAFEARLTTRSADRIGLADLFDAARSKPIIPGVIVVVGVLFVITGFSTGVALALLGMLSVVVLSIPARMALADQRHARQALCGSLAAILGASEQQLWESPDWGIDTDGSLWVSPLPPASHARLLGVERHEADGLIARSLPDWQIKKLDDQGLRLVPVTDVERARRAAMAASGGLFAGEGEDTATAPALNVDCGRDDCTKGDRTRADRPTAERVVSALSPEKPLFRRSNLREIAQANNLEKPQNAAPCQKTGSDSLVFGWMRCAHLHHKTSRSRRAVEPKSVLCACKALLGTHTKPTGTGTGTTNRHRHKHNRQAQQHKLTGSEVKTSREVGQRSVSSTCPPCRFPEGSFYRRPA